MEKRLDYITIQKASREETAKKFPWLLPQGEFDRVNPRRSPENPEHPEDPENPEDPDISAQR